MRKAIRSMVAALAVTCAVAAVSVPTLAASTPEDASTPENATAVASNTGLGARPTAGPGEYTFEMAEWDRLNAIANGTWGAEYTTCPKCGYHNWTRQGNVYVCDTCGNTTATVKGAKGVKGFVAGTEGIAPVAASAETTVVYATPAQAQAAAEVREANYAAAVAAFQKQIAAQNAAYLAALGK